MIQTIKRAVPFENKEISYLLEQKQVKNLNLRIRKDGSVYVSASPLVPVSQIDAFVESKGAYILNAQEQFAQMAQYAPGPKQYVSGETFYVLGHGLRLKLEQADKNQVYSDGVYLYLQVKEPDDFSKKERLVNRYLDEQCRTVFQEVMEEIYPLFRKYGVPMPVLRIRSMETRWGSCLVKKGIITLNKRLLEAPRNCIEYVVMHEFCHFIHPNHSKQFYAFLAMLMPDWKERKMALERNAAFWL